jgi:HK97 family phage prohead protease
MPKIDLTRARQAFQQSKLAKTKVHVLFPDGLNLAVAAQTARDSNSEYIELAGYASTPVMNDRGFIIAASAWGDPEAFARIKDNPIVLFVHRQDHPVGQIASYEARPDGLWVVLRVRYNALLPTGEKLGDLVADGTLRALSIGIDEILDFEVVEDDKSVTPIVTKLRLAEISIVSIGSDPGAICSISEEFTNIFQLASITDESKKEGITMWKILAKKFGMGDDATEEQVMAEYQRRETLGAQAIVGLGLDPNNMTAEQLTAALAQRDPGKLAKLNAQNLVNTAVINGFIAVNDEDTKTFALSLAEANVDQFGRWLALQKPVVPDTRNITGAGAGLGGKPNQGGPAFITNEDREMCLTFGVFDTVEKMDEMAETSPNVALGWVLGQNFPATTEDKKVLAARKRLDLACGIQR